MRTPAAAGYNDRSPYDDRHMTIATTVLSALTMIAAIPLARGHGDPQRWPINPALGVSGFQLANGGGVI